MQPEHSPARIQLVTFLFPEHQHLRLLQFFHAATAVLALALGGCAGRPVASFQQGRPVFKPEEFFAGHTHSWGILETPSGQPEQILHTQTRGTWDDGTLKFEQDLEFEHGKNSHRSWIIHRLDAHHYTATGTGIIGTAQGEAYGNTFHLIFTLDAFPGHPLGRLQMSQWMYLQADGVTMINRDTLTKDGVIVKEITEQFKKDR